jgi:hypothetical protein
MLPLVRFYKWTRIFRSAITQSPLNLNRRLSEMFDNRDATPNHHAINHLHNSLVFRSLVCIPKSAITNLLRRRFKLIDQRLPCPPRDVHGYFS